VLQACPDSAARLQNARLYAISEDLDEASLLRWAEDCIRGGADVVQLRQKSMPRGRVLQLARALATAVHQRGAILIVNDYLDIALLSGADGVHLGPDDLSVAAARRQAPAGFVIGASASTPASARDAVAAGASYIGAGPAFATPVKPLKQVIAADGIAAVQAAVAVPVFAIGGINDGNLDELTARGIHRVCVIHALAGGDAAAAARRLRQKLDA
jgi:thiamine-phosphate diphosphorylase